MIVINTLKMARAMRAAGVPEKQAEALADSLEEGMRETVVTRDFLSSELAKLTISLTNKMYGIAVGIVVSTGLIQYFVK